MAADDERGPGRRNGNRNQAATRSGKKKVSGRWKHWARRLFLVSAFLLVTLAVTPSSLFQPDLEMEEGEIAAFNVKSDQEFTVIDDEATRARRQQAGGQVLPVFDDDVEAVEARIASVTAAFEELRQRLWKSPALYQPVAKAVELSRGYLSLLVAALELSEDEAQEETASEMFDWTGKDGQVRRVALKEGQAAQIWDIDGFLERERVYVADHHGLQIPAREFRLLADHWFAPRLQTAIVSELRHLLVERGIVASVESLQEISKAGFVRRARATGAEVAFKGGRLLSLSQATERFAAKTRETFSSEPRLRDAVLAVAGLVLKPNLTYNEQETLRRRRQAQAAIESVGYLVKANEMIVREGDPVTPTQRLKLKKLRHLKKRENFVFLFLGVALLLFLAFTLFYQFCLERQFPSVRSRPELLLLLVAIFVTVVVVCRLLLAVGSGLAASATSAPWNHFASYYFALPFCTGAMLVALVMEARLAVLLSILFAIVAGMLLGGSVDLVAYTFLSSLAGVSGMTTYRQRSGIWRAGFLVSLTNVVVVFPLAIIGDRLLTSVFALDVICAAVGGLLTVFLISGLVPLFEHVFDVTTDFKLLELANLEHPLLKDMILRAPGTYHHSFMVGSLAESAAEAVDADSLLSKVGSYYHDIGKMKNPSFFVENMRAGQKNKHEKIQPSLSALIITSHVKEGVELAKKHKLGRAIIDIIQQHHGTTLVTYFFNKAKTMEDADVSEVLEADYRYDGPKPQTREAAIVMIADSCEAASRTLKTPNYPKVRELVKKIVEAKVNDGQFDECSLTFRDLHQISRALEKVLMAQFHSRIDYPGFVFEERTAETVPSKARAASGS